jgi:antitoxin component of MazEF toxin-antitoxin module
MQVAKWGNSLAVRLPKKLVDELGLKPGDEISLVSAGKGALARARWRLNRIGAGRRPLRVSQRSS